MTCDRSVVSSTNETDRHEITEILLKVELNTITSNTENYVVGPLGSTTGKCSHGGPDDESRKLIAKCGINKETTIERLSPHYHLHNDAYLAAVAATKYFLIGKGIS